MNYWLVKSESETYSIWDLKRDTVTSWTGVRNYQARNFMRDSMRVGDLVLFYHSNSKPSGIYGTAQVASAPHVDTEALDPNSKYYDPKSTKDNPIWICVDIAFVNIFTHPISLQEIKNHPVLCSMSVAQKGSRLSIHPVRKQHFDIIQSYSQ